MALPRVTHAMPADSTSGKKTYPPARNENRNFEIPCLQWQTRVLLYNSIIDYRLFIIHGHARETTFASPFKLGVKIFLLFLYNKSLWVSRVGVNRNASVRNRALLAALIDLPAFHTRSLARARLLHCEIKMDSWRCLLCAVANHKMPFDERLVLFYIDAHREPPFGINIAEIIIWSLLKTGMKSLFYVAIINLFRQNYSSQIRLIGYFFSIFKERAIGINLCVNDVYWLTLGNRGN